jgi:hypothetical protein
MYTHAFGQGILAHQLSLATGPFFVRMGCSNAYFSWRSVETTEMDIIIDEFAVQHGASTANRDEISILRK